MRSFYGEKFTWKIDSTWRSHLSEPGATQFKYVGALFGSRAWYQLVPDQKHMMVVSGLGTFSSTGNAQDNDYATTARTANGTLLITYMPTARTMTVDMTKLARAAVGRWFDPTSGKYLDIAGSPFPNTGMKKIIQPTWKNKDGFA